MKDETSLHPPYKFKIMFSLVRSGDRIPVGARFSAPVQTGPRSHPASCTMGTGSFSGVKSGWGVTLTPHPILGPWSRKSRAIPLLPLWAGRPVQRLSACTRVHFTFYYLLTREEVPQRSVTKDLQLMSRMYFPLSSRMLHDRSISIL